MTQTLIIAGRELREKSRLFLLAAVLSVMPFITLLLPHISGNDRMAVLAMATTFTAIALAFGLAAVLGASTIGRELTERRLSFYFARPVGAGAIWGGKAIASIATALLAFLIVLIPTGIVLVPTLKRIRVLETLRGIGTIAAVVVALFLVAHVVSTMIRSRSALGALDLAGVAATVYALVAIIRPAAIGLQSDVIWIIGPVLLLMAIVLAGAPVYQLQRGRTDVRRSHAALSIALWSGMAAVVLLTFLGVAWLRGSDPLAFDKLDSMQQSPNSSWVYLEGTDHSRFGYRSSYLVNTATGQRERLNGKPWSEVQFSRDGRVAAWLQPHEVYIRDFELYVRPLDRPGRSIAIGVRMPAPRTLALSPDGSRIAVASNDLVTVYDVASRNVLASARATGGTLYFTSNDLLRVVAINTPRRGDATMTLRELDVPSKKLTTTGAVKVPHDAAAVSVNADATRMLVRGTPLIVDARTGATITTLPNASRWFSTAMLPDGTVVDAARVNGAIHLRTYTPDGKPARDIALDAKHAWLVGHIGGKRIVLATSKKPEMKMMVIDLERGEVVHSAPGHASVMPFRSAHLPEIGTKLAVSDEESEVTLFDPRTGETSAINM